MAIRARDFAFLFALGLVPSFGALGCSASSEDEVSVDENEIVNVPQTDVERQAIGNCWLYAHASWAESLHLHATGEAFDVSQSYWTYWHWFDQIAGGYSSKISTGGNWDTANNIVSKYGLIAEKDFVFADTTTEMSARQASAERAINASLATGALRTSTARRDKALLRRELDRAWGLTSEVTRALDSAFGTGVTRTFASRTTTASTAGTKIIRGQDFEVSYPSQPGAAPSPRKLTDAQREWRQVYYSAGSQSRTFQQRVQRALHDAQPVIITWFVDFNAMENRDVPLKGSFNMDTLNEFGPGRQGGHMTVLEDYEAELADGTVLAAGETLDPKDPADAALLSSALETGTNIRFLRVKNSWGAARPDRAFAPGMPGYHDLYMDYLNGPVKKCNTTPDGETDTKNCPFDQTPLKNVVLPPGY